MNYFRCVKKALFTLLVIIGIASPTKPLSVDSVFQITDVLISKVLDVSIQAMTLDIDLTNQTKWVNAGLCSHGGTTRECAYSLIEIIESGNYPKPLDECDKRIFLVYLYFFVGDQTNAISVLDDFTGLVDICDYSHEMDAELTYFLLITAHLKNKDFEKAKRLADEQIFAEHLNKFGMIHLVRGMANYKLGYLEDACSDWVIAADKLGDDGDMGWFAPALLDAACPWG
jgi:tetratricopeptide (TPR) repeat protein